MANPSLHPRRGEIWWVRFEPVVGSEVGKERPAVVVQGDDLGRLPVRVVVPITGWDARYAEHVWLTGLVPDAANGLSKPSGADALQIRTVSIQRYRARLGELPMSVGDEIANSIAACVGAPK